MNQPLIGVRLHELDRVYHGGATLSGEFQVDAIDPTAIQAVELSILWQTEGKGDEDLAVHYFQRFAEGEGEPLHELRQFSARLPHSPLSYEGLLIKIRWCVRVRVFFARSREVYAELPFQLGHVPAVQPVLAEVE